MFYHFGHYIHQEKYNFKGILNFDVQNGFYQIFKTGSGSILISETGSESDQILETGSESDLILKTGSRSYFILKTGFDQNTRIRNPKE